MTIIEQYEAIEAERCRKMLDVLVKHHATDALVTDLYGPLAEANTAVHKLLADSPIPPAPDTTTAVPLDDPTLWVRYGTWNGEDKWGQGQGRTGVYIPTAISLYGETYATMKSGTTANGRPGWFCGFSTTRDSARPVYPLFGRYEVRARFDTTPGFWPAPLWLRLVPGGAGSAEIDLCEWFGNDPANVRQAVHMRPAGGKTVYNIGTRLGCKQARPLADLSGWHTYAVDITGDRADVRIDFSIDGNQTYGFSLAEASKLGDFSQVFAQAQGWDLAICTQTEGDSGPFTPGATGPYVMQVSEVRVPS